MPTTMSSNPDESPPPDDAHDEAQDQDQEQEQDQDQKQNTLSSKKKKSAESRSKKKIQLEKKFTVAKRKLEVDLPEEARRADAYPGWVRE